MGYFDAKVMRIDARAKLDFLYDRCVLMLLGFLVLLRLLVAVLAVIHNATNWRCRIRGNFDEVHTIGARQVQGLVERHNTQLLAVYSDHPNLAGTDFPVDPGERTGKGRVSWRERATQDTLVGCGIFFSFGFKRTGNIASLTNRPYINQ